MYYGADIVGLLILALDIYMIYLVLISSHEAVMKLLWIVVILLLPLIGPILYFLLGQRRGLA